MIVEQDGCQCRYIYFELLLCRYLRCEFGVQGVYSFHHKYIVFIKMKPFSALFAHTCLKVIFRQIYLFSVEERIELLVDKWDVQCVNALVIQLSVLVFGRFVAVDKVIVERYLYGFDAVGEHLDGQTLTESGLTR